MRNVVQRESMQRRRSPQTSQGFSEAWKGGKHDHILLKPSDEARMRDNMVTDVRLIEQRHHPIGMMLNLLWNLLSHERAFRIPPQHDLAVRRIPHQRQWIQLTIERTLFIDAAG
jgi:hypothetical protein